MTSETFSKSDLEVLGAKIDEFKKQLEKEEGNYKITIFLILGVVALAILFVVVLGLTKAWC